jgi:hypothetical protein
MPVGPNRDRDVFLTAAEMPAGERLAYLDARVLRGGSFYTSRFRARSGLIDALAKSHPGNSGGRAERRAQGR